ncbi:hypothetical protein [Luteibacter sp.]|uniref:hypothetical protein n=1 Tax=Luteibacter sp. TaxID=1886636 RepID=UPI003F81466C
MDYLLVLDAMAPSARLNVNLGDLVGSVGDGPPTALSVPVSEIDTSHTHLLRAKATRGDGPIFWVPYSHLVGILEAPEARPPFMGFRPS